jgi:hypothetical protein
LEMPSQYWSNADATCLDRKSRHNLRLQRHINTIATRKKYPRILGSV